MHIRVPSREIHLKTRLAAVNATWGRRCDKLVYLITNTSLRGIPGQYDVINVDIPDKRQTLTEKSVFANTWMYEHHLEEFDWFLKADDDTYVVMENMKFMLSRFNASVPGYIGCQFKHFAPQGYHSGGAGYLFNRAGLRLLVEQGYRRPGHCRMGGGAEDIETGRCAAKAGVRTLDQLDSQRRETFFPSNVYANVVGPMPDWAKSYMRSGAGTRVGLECCSPLLVSFHYTGEKLMYTIEFLLYRVSVHGRRYMAERAGGVFDGRVAADMDKAVRRRAYPGESIDEYYGEAMKKWREENATIYINPNV